MGRLRLFSFVFLVVAAIATQPALAVDLEQATLRIDAMAWPDTGPRRAKAVLERLLGVKHAEVSLPQGQAVVHYDPREVSIQTMLELLTTTGYRASAP